MGFLEVFLELPRAPGFELIHHVVRLPPGGRDDHVDVLRSGVDDMQMPMADPAMVGDGFRHP